MISCSQCGWKTEIIAFFSVSTLQPKCNIIEIQNVFFICKF
jgi:hypothetical protein